MEAVDVCGEEYYTELGAFTEENSKKRLIIARTYHDYLTHEDGDVEEISVIFDKYGNRILAFDERSKKPNGEEFFHETNIYDYNRDVVIEIDWYSGCLDACDMDKNYEFHRF